MNTSNKNSDLDIFTTENGVVISMGKIEINESKSEMVVKFLTDLGFSDIEITMESYVNDGLFLSVKGDFEKSELKSEILTEAVDDYGFDDCLVFSVLSNLDDLETENFTVYNSDLNETQTNFIKSIDELVFDVLIN